MLIAIVVAALAVGGGATYYATKNSQKVQENNIVDNSQQNSQNNNSQKIPGNENGVINSGGKAPVVNPIKGNTNHSASASNCGLTINTPTPNSSAAFPFTISGTIDNTNASTLGCSWTMFEGHAGTAHLYDLNSSNNQWHAVGLDIPVTVSNWMTIGPTSFSLVVPFNNINAGLPSGTLMKVMFTEENPSGNTADTLDLPLLLQ